MTLFVWSKMQAEAGESLSKIISRKELERSAGAGEFWWGIGSSLGRRIYDVARAEGGCLPVIFSQMISVPKKIDSSPNQIFVWSGWRTLDGRSGKIPKHVLITSGRSSGNKRHYALVCLSKVPLRLSDIGPLDPNLFKTQAGKVPGASQVTAILDDTMPGEHPSGRYRWGFRAQLVSPLFVELTNETPLTSAQRNRLGNFCAGDSWLDLVEDIKNS